MRYLPQTSNRARRAALAAAALFFFAPSTAGCGAADATSESPISSMDSGAPASLDGGTIAIDDASTPAPDGALSCAPPAPPPAFDGCNPDIGIECDGDWRGPNPATGREYCDPACGAGECCSPQGGRFACVPRDARGECPAPDLFPDADRIRASVELQYREFPLGDCAIVEGCVAGSGMRRLLRFDTWTPNVGTADLYMGHPTDSSPYYQYSSCHMHYHFNSYARYELLTPDGECVAAVGHKQAFCLLDFYRYPGDVGGRGAVYNCTNQGIQSGWQDVYARDLDCQWIDVTGIPEGDYVLRISLNGEHVIHESDYDNDVVDIPVTITSDPGPPAVDLTSDCDAGTTGVNRDCGWTRAYSGTCTAGETVTIGCSAACGVGSCTGDTVMRVCDTALGNDCGAGLEIASNDDSPCGTADCGRPGGDCCSEVTFTCPGVESYTVWVGSWDPSDAFTCDVEVR